jgi:predicted DNA-binding protein
MASDRITIRLSETLGERLRRRSRLEGQPESALIRQALETYLGRSGGSRPAYDLAEEAGLIGCIAGSRGSNPRKLPPRDLSTNPRHLEGLGKHR